MRICRTDAQPRTRVLIVGLNRLLTDLVSRFVNAEPDMQVVGTPIGDEDLLSAAERTNASVLLLSADDPELIATAERLLDAFPRVGVVALQQGGRETVVLEFRPYFVRYGELSPDALADAIRTAALPLQRHVQITDDS